MMILLRQTATRYTQNRTLALRPHRGFTLVELLVTIVMVLILATLVLVGIGPVKKRAQLSSSLNRVRDIGVMVISYATDHNELPVWHDYNLGKYWWQLLLDEQGLGDPDKSAWDMSQYTLQSINLFKSPGHREFDPQNPAQTLSYGWNYPVVGRHKGDGDFLSDNVMRLSNIPNLDRTLALCDGSAMDGWGFVNTTDHLPDPERYNGKVAAFILDGSVRVLHTPEDFREDSPWMQPIKPLEFR